MKRLIPFALMLTPVAGIASIYYTGFEAPQFHTGEVHQQNNWSAAYSNNKSLVSIVDNNQATIAPPEGTQMLHLVRPTAESYPAAGIIFYRDVKPLKSFTATFKLAYEAKSTFPRFAVLIGSAAETESGVVVGIGYFEEKGKRLIYFKHGRGKERKPVPAPNSTEPVVALPNTFYDFIVTVHDEGQRYDLTIKQGEQIVAEAKDVVIPQPPQESYNRVIISIPGGSMGDQLYFDDLNLHP